MPRSTANHLLQLLHPFWSICRVFPRSSRVAFLPLTSFIFSSARARWTLFLQIRWSCRAREPANLRNLGPLSSPSFLFPQCRPQLCCDRLPKGDFISSLPSFHGDMKDLFSRSVLSTSHGSSQLPYCLFSPTQFLCISTQYIERVLIQNPQYPYLNIHEIWDTMRRLNLWLIGKRKKKKIQVNDKENACSTTSWSKITLT